MSSFYTRTGDDGYTGLLGDERVPKYHPQTEAVGALDEASAALGVARAACLTDTCRSILLNVQRDLYGLMAEVSSTPENASRFRKITTDRVAWLEAQTDMISSQVEIPAEFIVSGDSQSGAALDLARTVVRRAERQVAHLVHNHEIDNEFLLSYLNRLSSLCFVLELLENREAGQKGITLAKTK
jgi:cob(I)alamin adenosyltransferase